MTTSIGFANVCVALPAKINATGCFEPLDTMSDPESP